MKKSDYDRIKKTFQDRHDRAVEQAVKDLVEGLTSLDRVYDASQIESTQSAPKAKRRVRTRKTAETGGESQDSTAVTTLVGDFVAARPDGMMFDVNDVLATYKDKDLDRNTVSKVLIRMSGDNKLTLKRSGSGRRPSIYVRNDEVFAAAE